jgi:hypothetical protein
MSPVSIVIISGLTTVGFYILLGCWEYAVRFQSIPTRIWQEDREVIQSLREAIESRWPAVLKANTRQAFVDNLTGHHCFYAIYHNSSSNCADFALLLNEVLTEAGCVTEQEQPEPMRRIRIRPGLSIMGRRNDAERVAAAIRAVLKLDVDVFESEESPLQLRVGDRIIASM